MVEGILYRNLINVYNCHPSKLAEVGAVQNGLEEVLTDIKQDTTDFFYQFSPKGVTGMYLWPKGHFSIHTWPERGMAAMDVVGYPYDERILMRRLQNYFPANYVPVQSTRSVKRRTPRVGQEVYGTLRFIKNMDRLNQEKNILDLLKDISTSARFKVIGEVSRSNEEVIDAAVILAESHFSIHYNRTRKEMAVDIFTCGNEGDPHLGYEFLKQEIGAQELQRVEVRR